VNCGAAGITSSPSVVVIVLLACATGQLLGSGSAAPGFPSALSDYPYNPYYCMYVHYGQGRWKKKRQNASKCVFPARS
jgi:hypothetical protein